jgi:hypothetical protein
VTRRLNATIVDSPRQIVVFLVLTVLFAGGVRFISIETDSTDSFTEDLLEQQALDAVNEEFEPPFEPDSESTQLIHTGDNGLTKGALAITPVLKGFGLLIALSVAYSFGMAVTRVAGHSTAVGSLRGS